MSDNHKIVQAEVATIQQQDDLHPLVSLAMNSSGELDIEKLRELRQLQKEWEADNNRKSYTRAMVALKKNMPSIIGRDEKVDYLSKKGGRVKYSFAKLATAMEQIEPHLSEYGFSMSWLPVTTERTVSVTARLTHVDGHYEEATMTGPHDNSGGKNAIQAIGSTQSYLERYGGLALLGVVTRDMPDADDPGPDNDIVVDANKNIQAVAYMQSVGISLEKAQSPVGKEVRMWTANDLAKLRELVKSKQAAPQPPPEPAEPSPPTEMSEKKKELIHAAELFYGYSHAKGEIRRLCRERGADFATVTDEQCKSMTQEINAEADREALG